MISKLDERDVSQTTIHVLSTPSLTGSLSILSSLVNVGLLIRVLNFVSNFQPDLVHCYPGKFQCLSQKLSVCTLNSKNYSCLSVSTLWLHH